MKTILVAIIVKARLTTGLVEISMVHSPNEKHIKMKEAY